jgi:signal transduction histidine kinase/ABC-type amino acid transport substrate-binding protein/ActR/RegA family two-component response regulator
MLLSLRRFGGWKIICLLFGALPRMPAAPASESPVSPVQLLQRQPLRVGVFTDAYPYSYIDSEGRPAGFTADVLDAVAKAVNLRIVRIAAPTDQVVGRFQRGEFDLLQYHGITPARQAYAEFSTSFLSLQGCVYVRSDGVVRSLKDLNGLPFGLIGTTGQGERLLRDNGIEPRIVRVPTQEELLQRIATGELEGGFLSQLTELSVARKLHLNNIKILGRPFDGYDIQQAFAVHPGDAELLARLNEGIAIVQRTGEYDRIYRKNFSQFGLYILSVDELKLAASIALEIGFIVALWGYFRQRKLRKAISLQASALAEQQALLQALYDNIPMAMTVIDTGPPGPRILSMNRQACALYFVDSSEATGQPLDSLPVSEDIRRHLSEAIAHPMADGHVYTSETSLKIGQRILEVTAIPLASPGGPATARICVLVEDITKRRQQDAEVAQSRRLRAVGELVGGIAHEFNNLLTPVMLKAGEIQMSRPDDTALQQDIEVISLAVQRTAELTRRLLTFGRKVEHKPEAVRLEAIARGCFDLLKNTIDRRISWENSIPPDLLPLHLNATDLNQVLLNLLLNARDALLERLAGRNPAAWTPKITVEAEQLLPAAFEMPRGHSGKTLLGWQRLTVRDNGLGMPPDIIERIFEPFFTTKGAGKGTGLGLATAWHLVTDAGGRLDVESTLGVGSAFHVFLPIWPTAEEPKPAAVSIEAAKPARVLLVEDEVLVADPVVEILRRGGHQVRHIRDGLEAWKHLAENIGSYDLAIIDVNLPGMNGIDIVARLREREFPGRILMLSGRFTSSDMAALTRLGIDRSLTKPFNVRQFLEAVGESLGSSRA